MFNGRTLRGGYRVFNLATRLHWLGIEGCAFKRAANVLCGEEAGHLILLGPSGRRFVGLDELGSNVWLSLTVPQTLDDLTSQVTSIYDVDAANARHDLETLLRRLLQAHLIERV